jgi:hypothetical protein
MSGVPLAEIVWPYRPDLLIRVDFLEWWRETRGALWPDVPETPSADAVRANATFFAEACRHPYFLQFSRKKRYRNAPPRLAEAAAPYAGGVAAFLSLAAGIERDGYDPGTPIRLRSAWIQRSTRFGTQPRRRWFIGDGCHRWACLAFRERGAALPLAWFSVERKLVHTPLDWRATLSRVGVLGPAELAGFDALFAGADAPRWDAVLDWTRGVRDRFRGLDLEKVFSRRAGEES